MTFVKPCHAVVLDPDTRRRLPPEGANVDASTAFWVKAIRDGDVYVVPDEPDHLEDRNIDGD